MQRSMLRLLRLHARIIKKHRCEAVLFLRYSSSATASSRIPMMTTVIKA